MLNSRWLETFTVLCETGHFTRAADRLAMTQPGVSQHLRKLEEQVGQALISRHGKRFGPTPAGEAVLAVGRDRRDEEKRLREAIRRDDPDRGELVVACSGSFAMLLYPRLLPVMHAAPHLVVRLEAMPQARIVQGVLEGRVDLGVAGRGPRQPRLEIEHLGREELCLVLPATARKRHVDFATLETLGFIAHPDGYTYADELLSLNFPDAFEGADRLRLRGFVNQISQIPAPVANGIGYTVLPRSGVDSYPEKDRLRVVRLREARHHDLCLLTRKGRVPPGRVRRIADLVRKVAGELASD